MTKADIKALLSQNSIPTLLQNEVCSKANSFINDELEVEVVVDTVSITIDVYNSLGEKDDSFTYSIPNPQINNNF